MAKQSNSWGHALQKLGPDRLAEEQTKAERYAARWYGGDPERARACKACTFGRMDHLDPAEYVASYNYVTGRAGRVSWAEKRVCAAHATRFAEKHGIDLATVPVMAERSRHALERILDGQEAAPEPVESFRAPQAPQWIGHGLPHPADDADPDGEALEVERRIESSPRHSVGGFDDLGWSAWQCGALSEDGACCVAEPDHEALLVAHHWVGGRDDLEIARPEALATSGGSVR